MVRKTHFINELGVRMNPEVLAKALKMTQKESLNIRLDLFQAKYGVKQSEIADFTQIAVLKLKNRKNIRIFTLIDNLDILSMESETNDYPKNSVKMGYCYGYDEYKASDVREFLLIFVETQ